MEALCIRAEVFSKIRAFFAERGLLEVETPLLASAPVTDLHLAALSTCYRGPGYDGGRRLWLQTSPEFAMKRLLAAGSGPIYQLCKAFRDGEAGSRHNPEFTILEWYRPGWDHHRLMDEVAELFAVVLGSGGGDRVDNTRLVGGVFRPRDQPVEGRHRDPAASHLEGHDDAHVRDAVDRGSGSGSGSGSGNEPIPYGDDGVKPSRPHALKSGRAEWLTYAEAFQRHIGIDPHTASSADLASRSAELLNGPPPDLGDDRDAWLDLLMSHAVEPELGRGGPTFIYDYPASQAALAKIRAGTPPVAERFEAWIEGVELANGYHELTDPAEQRTRFETDLAARRDRDLPEVPVDHRLLAAMEHGLPDCAGVALGVDRLVMLAAGADRIDEVIAFPIDRA
jgi:EF-P lysine aminoacylase GenX